jgi:hypothetical protein
MLSAMKVDSWDDGRIKLSWFFLLGGRVDLQFEFRAELELTTNLCVLLPQHYPSKIIKKGNASIGSFLNYFEVGGHPCHQIIHSVTFLGTHPH